MIVKIGFEILNISMNEADKLIEKIEAAVSKWAMDKSNAEKRNASNWIDIYMFDKSIRNERIKDAKP